jgi:hypothetical protein
MNDLKFPLEFIENHTQALEAYNGAMQEWNQAMVNMTPR